MDSTTHIFLTLLWVPFLSIGQNAINPNDHSNHYSSDNGSSIKPCKRSTKSLSWIRDSMEGLNEYAEKFILGGIQQSRTIHIQNKINNTYFFLCGNNSCKVFPTRKSEFPYKKINIDAIN